MSPEAIETRPPFAASLSLDETSEEVIVSRPLIEVAVGFRRNDDVTLPTGPADERVFDADGDGYPGVTVHMEGPVSGDIM